MCAVSEPRCDDERGHRWTRVSSWISIGGQSGTEDVCRRCNTKRVQSWGPFGRLRESLYEDAGMHEVDDYETE